MRLGFAARLLALAVAVAAAAALAVSAILAARLEKRLYARAEADLSARLALLVERPDAATLVGVDNPDDLPEVARALRSGGTVIVRTGGSLVAAAPVVRGGKTAGVVRVAVPVADLDETVATARHLSLLAAALAFVVALLCWAADSRRIGRVVRTLTATARRLGKGELDARARVNGEGGGELSELGATLDGLAVNLTHAIGELRGERDLLSGVLEAMDEGVLLLDGNGRIALVNRALREMLLLPADVVGRPPIEVIRQADLQGLVEQAEGAPGPVHAEIDVPGVKPRRMMVHARALRGEQAGVLTVFVDVTDLRRLETLRRDFVANVSHELRTPVTSIRTAAETLHGGAKDDPVAGPRFLDVIERNAERLQSLVEDLLDLSRIESRQYRFRPEDVELGQVLLLVEEALRSRAAKSGVRVRSELPPDLPRLRADRRALEQVLTNLLENAVKYGGDGGEVVARARAENGKVQVMVCDSGPGIEPRHLPRIFERFYRVDAGRSRDKGGTGLGLAIVKNLVEAMGGTVGVESEAGKGATFSVTLPAA